MIKTGARGVTNYKYIFVLVSSILLLFSLAACGGGGGGGGTTPSMVSVSGTVLDSLNSPVPFATVTITSTPEITTTGSDGVFQADVEEGDHRIAAMKSGVSFLDTSFTTSSDPTNLGDLIPTVSYYPWYHDSDSDTYGDPYDVIDSQASPGPAYTRDFSDCDDSDGLVNPGATEICNGDVDDNCNGLADDADSGVTGQTTWYLDADSDTYYISTTSQCTSPGAGYSTSPGAGGNDCDDGSAGINPGASEVCDGIDNNCNGTIDDGLTLDTFYADSDGDDYGDPAVASSACAAPAGYIVDNTDCDDDAIAVNPAAIEVCNGIDDDCDDLIDDADSSVTGQSTWYLDADSDNYYISTASQCTSPGAGYSTSSGSGGNDCDDGDAGVNPGATEVCSNGIDDDCADGDALCETWYKDYDGDLYSDMYASPITQPNRPGGYYLESELTDTETDCNDVDASVNPSATDIIGDGIDQDCDGRDAGTLTLPDTGQITCNNSSGNAISCAGTGQDGEYSINPMSFTDNGNGTITDNVTGLMWQQGENESIYNWYEAYGAYDATYNPSSTDVCGNLSLADFTDWRLPTKKELLSIVNYEVYDPAIDIAYFPNTNSTMNSSNYWSSDPYADTPYQSNTPYAWQVFFFQGDAYGYDVQEAWYVRCVR